MLTAAKELLFIEHLLCAEHEGSRAAPWPAVHTQAGVGEYTGRRVRGAPGAAQRPGLFTRPSQTKGLISPVAGSSLSKATERGQVGSIQAGGGGTGRNENKKKLISKGWGTLPLCDRHGSGTVHTHPRWGVQNLT